MMKKLKLQVLQKFLSRLSKREKNIVYFSALLLLLLILDRIIIYPIYSKIKSLNNEIKAKELSISKNLRIVTQKQRILHETIQYASFLSNPESEEEGMTSLLKVIANIANKNSLYIIDMKPAGLKEDKNNIKRYLVNLSCEGQMEQIMDFMYNLENSNELLAVEKYQLNPKSKESSIAQCSMTISKIVIP